MSRDAMDIFRKEAIEHHQAGQSGKGDVLHLSPAWLPWTYRLLAGLSLVGILFLCLGRVHEWAPGPAVIRATGRVDLTYPFSATVNSVEVQPGQRVEAGQVLVRFESTREQAEYERVNHEFELQLANRLRDPLASGSQQTVAALRAQRDFARQQLDARALYAPFAGLVSDVRTRPGQQLMPGQIAATLLEEAATFKVTGVLPGHFRPQLEVGMPIRLELSGYSHAYRTLPLTYVGDEVIGPTEARRFLGSDVADAVPISGPVILVEAELTEETFTASGRRYAYHDGMHATMEVKVHSDPIILTLIPGLRSLTEVDDD